MTTKPKRCTCGSGKYARWENDARGIPLCRACDDCRAERLSHYRPDVLTDANYFAEEPIDPID
jgi:hypothetical protein